MHRSAAELPRVLAPLAILVAVVTLVLVIGGGDGSYEVRARFLDAGQLVKGNLVEVAGQRVGKVKDIRVTDDGRAEVVLRITSERYRPLHRGTRLTIRTVGLAGVANRYIEVQPGSRQAPAIADGGVLQTDATTGIVDLDQLLDAFGPPARRDLRAIIVASAHGVRGNARATNRLLRYLSPAVGQTRALLEDVTADDAAVGRLTDAASQVAAALASRDADITPGIDGAARTLAAVAGEHDALRSALRRAPDVLGRARGTLRGVRQTLSAVRPALREARPAAGPLATLLRRIVPTARAAAPVLGDVEQLLPPLRQTLALAPALAGTGVPALRSTTSAVRSAAPIFRGLRAYILDVLRGLATGIGPAAGYYDANGHYARVVANLDIPGVSKAGLLSLLPNLKLPPLNDAYIGATARCPGSLAGPLLDGSDRVPVDPAFCNPADGR